jgi:hypothetical protein
LVCFVWGDEFDREHGKYSSNNLHGIIKLTALAYDEHQNETARPMHERYLSINKRGLWEILRYHAATKPDNSFGTDDIKLFFEKPSNAFNDANQWMNNIVDELMRHHPEKRRNRRNKRASFNQ